MLQHVIININANMSITNPVHEITQQLMRFIGDTIWLHFLYEGDYLVKLCVLIFMHYQWLTSALDVFF